MINLKKIFPKKSTEESFKSRHPKLNRTIWILLGVFTFLLVFVAFFLFLHIRKAPDISEIDATPDGYLTTVLDRDGNIIAHLSSAESNRIYVKLEEIPIDLQNAFIAIEDARFYQHGGIDIKGIFRALFVGIKEGGFSQGASTITQQLLKNNVLTTWTEEKTFYDRLSRKIQEQYLAIRLEDRYTKEWILENYLNTINLGGGTRGVQVAAQYYFGKDVSELSLAQCALIAGITRNPSANDPMRHPDAGVARQKLVLNAMLEKGYITREEYEDALLENVISKLNTDAANAGVPVFSWFEDALLEQIVHDLTQEYTYTEEDAWNLIYSGGLKIYSTQDTKMQEICENTAMDPQWYAGEEELSIVMTDVKTGAVSAIVGGREEKESSLVYNRATESIRQPGSTAKVIGEYAAALDTGAATLGTTLDDAPYTYFDGTSIHNSYGEYRGMTTLHESIVTSGNIVALKTFQLVGVDTVYEYLQRFGLTTLTEADKNEALSLGGTYNGVTNLELTAAYNAIANSGIYKEPYFYTKVVDRDGDILLERGLQFEQAIEKESAELLTAAMEDVILEGTGKEAAVEGVTLAGKSGTTNQNKDLWFVGFSGYYTCGIWGGFDNNSPQEGSNYVKRIWQSIMTQAHAGKEDLPLVDTTNLTTVTICKKCGNLAMGALCESTQQGDMTVEEYYLEGTEPTTYCDCHIRITVCEESGTAPGLYCPRDSRVTKVYLKTATEGTEDVPYVFPEGIEEKCRLHKTIFDPWLPSGKGDDDSNEDTTEPDQPQEDESSWWENIFGF